MKLMKGDSVIVDELKVADSFLSKTVGLLGYARVPNELGIWFPKTNAIHMWGMRDSIDVIFLKESRALSRGSEVHVTKIVHGVKPWKLLPLLSLRSGSVIELQAGKCMKYDIKKGDTLCIA